MIAFIAAICVIVILALYILIHFENKRFRITEYVIITEKIDRPITLAVLSDLHDYQYGNSNDKIIDSLNSIKPDYVVSAGDMIEARRRSSFIDATVLFLKRLVLEFNFIYGMGNHESKLICDKKEYPETSRVYINAIRKAHEELKEISPEKSDAILPLDNKVISSKENNIKIYGLNLEKKYFKKVIVNKTSAEHISELVGEKDKEMFNILIGHNPDQFDAYCEWGADLVLSGHIHGGMIATPWGRGLISPRYMLLPKYDHGEYKKGNTTMLLSRGLGNHTVHVRIFNRAEIMVVRLMPRE